MGMSRAAAAAAKEKEAAEEAAETGFEGDSTGMAVGEPIVPGTKSVEAAAARTVAETAAEPAGATNPVPSTPSEEHRAVSASFASAMADEALKAAGDSQEHLPGAAANSIDQSDADPYNGDLYGSVDFETVVDLSMISRLVKLRDKVSFVLGVGNVSATSYILGASPGLFYQFHTLYAFVLLVIRYFMYKRARWHYYLFDFCYYDNLLMAIYVWLYPQSATLFRVIFIFTAGPVALSIPTFRNSLVFHDLDKMTSVFVHLSPALVVWTVRWWPAERFHVCDEGENGCAVNLWNHLVLPMAVYFIWVFLYYLKVFVFSSKKIARLGYMTLYTYILESNTPFARMIESARQPFRPLVYVGIHVIFTILCCIPAMFLFNHFYAHTAFLIVIYSWSLWNGANFYFEVFAARYLAMVERRNLAEANHIKSI